MKKVPVQVVFCCGSVLQCCGGLLLVYVGIVLQSYNLLSITEPNGTLWGLSTICHCLHSSCLRDLVQKGRNCNFFLFLFVTTDMNSLFIVIGFGLCCHANWVESYLQPSFGGSVAVNLNYYVECPFSFKCYYKDTTSA